MAKISPFRGIRYNASKIDSFANVITPPYDVINKEKQNELYERSKFNLIRLEYGLEKDTDSDVDNRYTRAAETFNGWLKDEVLIRDDEAAIYLYEQEFIWKEKVFLREGIISTIKLEPYESKSVLPHEETLSKPKEDRLNVLRHCRANFSPIFGLYPDKEQMVREICSKLKGDTPIASFDDYDNQKHRLWKITDKSLQEKIIKLFADWSIFIADGHHRFETALHFSQIMNEDGKEHFDNALIFLFNMFDPDLLILPTHRIINGIKGFNEDTFFASLKGNFDVECFGEAKKEILDDFSRQLKEKGEKKSAIGLCAGNKLYHLVLNVDPGNLTLDVEILQKYIFENSLNFTREDLSGGEYLAFTRSNEEAMLAVKDKNAQLSFFLNFSPMEDVVASAEQGIRLPQKSTYFYPKLISGLLINKLGD